MRVFCRGGSCYLVVMHFDENSIVRLLERRFGRKAAQLIKGLGDDAAVVLPRNAAEYWAVTTDMLVEDVDFRRPWLSPRELGHKALAVNLSDMAAMGARPRFYTVAIGLPEDIGRTWIERFYEGMTRIGDSHGATLIGGDLSRSAHIDISLTVFGETLRKKVVYRSGGCGGDAVFVTGTLGKSAAGLELLKKACLRGRTKGERDALRSHRMPEPRCEVGLWLAQNGLATSMMDLSDGLSADLPRLCAAGGTGAEIAALSIPVFTESACWGCDPLELALHGGEDFELLFTVRENKVALLNRLYPKRFPPISQVGRLSGNPGVIRLSKPGVLPRELPALGYDHFRV
jgi:thiamine-monophosphate kinase